VVLLSVLYLSLHNSLAQAGVRIISCIFFFPHANVANLVLHVNRSYSRGLVTLVEVELGWLEFLWEDL